MTPQRSPRIALIVAAVLAFLPASPRAGIVLDLATVSHPRLAGTAPGEQFGYSVAAGDFDGDGTLDLAIGAPGRELPDVGPNAGAVHVFDAAAIAEHGGSPDAPPAASRLLVGDAAMARFGQTLAAGDLNGDAIDDLVIGSPAWGDESAIAAGRVDLFFGRAAPDGLGAAGTADLSITGGSAGDRFGSSVSVSDVDGDGLSELVVSAYRAWAPGGERSGIVYVIPRGAFEAASGEVTVGGLSPTLITGERKGDGLREVVLGDVDGDGRAEVIIGAQHADGAKDDDVDVGRIYVLPSSALTPGGIVSTVDAAVTVFTGRSPRGLLGSSMAVGDVDSDGIDDLILAAPAARGEGVKIEAWGECFLVFGREDGPASSTDLARDGALSYRARSRWDLYGLPVAVGDFNGDRNADLVFAAQFADSPDGSRRRCGEVYLFWGSLRSVMDAKAGTAKLADVTIVGSAEMESIGGALLVAPILGRLTPDLIIGAPDAAGGDAPGDRPGAVYVIPSEELRARPPR